ncbi:MAG: OsmC family protein, partial [Promethearchaeota archaeon]
PKGGVLNRINLDGFKVIQEKYTKDRLLCKKLLEVEGRWRLDVNYGPQFETELRTERAGKILVQTDETTMLGGGGTAIHPISLCMVGFGGCFTAAFAKWAAMQNIELNTLKIRAKANIDLSSSFGIDDTIPMIDNYQLDLFIESDATMDKFREILELTKLRCFCYYCATTPIFPTVLLRKEYSNNEFNTIQVQNEDHIVNRINLKGFNEIRKLYSENRSLCKKTLEIEGEWKLDVQYGPQYQTKLQTERAGEILLQTDETIILGGGGTSFHPVHLCMAGFAANFCSEYAKWAAIEGVKLDNLRIIVKQYIDLSTGFGIEPNVPMIDDYQVELIVDSNANIEKLLDILEIIKKRSFCYNCLVTPTVPLITIHKVISDSQDKSFKVVKKELIPETNIISISRENNLLLSSIFKKRKVMQMKKI